MPAIGAPWQVVMLALIGLVGPFICDVAAAQGEKLSESAIAISFGAEPVTVTLKTTPTFSSALVRAAQGGQPVVLYLDGIEAMLEQPVRLNVFVEKSDANRMTPPEDKHFVGYIQLLPRNRPTTVTSGAFDLSGIEIPNEAMLSVTIVPIAGKDSRPKGASITIKKMELRFSA